MRRVIIPTLLLGVLMLPTYASAQNASKGRQIFEDWCAVCHALDRDRSGPALGNVLPKWSGQQEHLVAFILNAPAYLKTDRPHVARLQAQVKKYGVLMNRFDQDLSAADVRDVLAYLKEAGKRSEANPQGGDAQTPAADPAQTPPALAVQQADIQPLSPSGEAESAPGWLYGLPVALALGIVIFFMRGKR